MHLDLDKEISFLRNLPLRILQNKPDIQEATVSLNSIKGRCSQCDQYHKVDRNGFLLANYCLGENLRIGFATCPICSKFVPFNIISDHPYQTVKIGFPIHYDEGHVCFSKKRLFEIDIGKGDRMVR